MSKSTRNRPQSRRATLLESLEHRIVLSAIPVTTLLDAGPGSLRAAVAAANLSPGPDTIQFSSKLKGTITLNSELLITSDLHLAGNDHQITLSGGGTTRLLHVTGATTDLSLENLTFTNGLATNPTSTATGGAILNEGATLNLTHLRFENNRATGQSAGGGAIATLGGNITANDVDFVNNSVHSDNGQIAWGGALYADQSADVVIRHSAFAHNQSLGGNANGGALAIVGGSDLTLRRSSFDSNSAQGDADDGSFGGAIQAQSAGFLASAAPTLVIAHCDFENNQAAAQSAAPGADANGQGNGGAIDIEDGVVMTIRHSCFDNNLAKGPDGGAGTAGNPGGAGGASFGGAIINLSSNLTMADCDFSNNQTQGGNGANGGASGFGGDGGFAIGGAVAASSLAVIPAILPTTAITDCDFTDNNATGGSGGAGSSNADGGFANRGDGGAIANLFGNITITRSDLTSNSAQGGAGGAPGAGGTNIGGDGGLARAGAFANERGGTATLSKSTIKYNIATGGKGAESAAAGNVEGGAIYNGRLMGIDPAPDQPATLTIKDTSIKSNQARGGQAAASGTAGTAQGAGIFNGNPTPVANTPILTLFNTTLTNNRAIAGFARASATAGQAQGGGLFNQTGAITNADSQTHIINNSASTSDDNIFGTVTPI